jgi:hypothetical protein
MRSALWAVVTGLILLAVACGGGAEDNNGTTGGMGAGTAGIGGSGGGGAGGSGPGVCGNGMVEQLSGEQCEMAVPVTTTCQSLGMGPGMILCNPASCKLMMMCMDAVPVAGNSGAMAGTGG